jgi:signal transduction histidine kinase
MTRPPKRHDEAGGRDQARPQAARARARGTGTGTGSGNETWEALRKQTEVLQSVLDSMGDAVVVADQDSRILMYNRAADRMFNIVQNTTPDEWSRHYGLYRNDTVTLFPTDELPLRRSIRGEEVNDVEMFVRPHGAAEGFWILVNGRPLRDADGALRGGVVVCRDITERYKAALELRRAYHDLKRAEVQLIQAEKLSALGQLIAGVAHEINNPLAFVANNMTVLRRDAQALRGLVQIHQQGMQILAAHDPKLHAQIAAACERIDLDYTLDGLERLLCQSAEGLHRIQQIVRDLRDFARLDEADRQVVDLNEGIRSTINIIAGHAKKQGVALVVELGTLPSLLCFPGKINQVVMNLVSNAVDACVPGGQVTVRTVAAGGPEPGSGSEGIEIHIIDNGRGIDPDIRERIFEAFFTTKPQGKGTGLGLSISAGIVQAHGGRIDVESAPGAGTHMTVFLPRTRPEPHLAGEA